MKYQPIPRISIDSLSLAVLIATIVVLALLLAGVIAAGGQHGLSDQATSSSSLASATHLLVLRRTIVGVIATARRAD